VTVRETVLVGARFRVDRFELEGRDGSVTTRELCVHPGAVVILPILDDGRVVLIRNHRPMLGRTLIELPAGTLEAGEDPHEAATRELEEETGYSAGDVRPMLTFLASPGITDETMHAYVARNLVLGATHLDPTESIERLELDLDEAIELIRSGGIADGKTIAVLLHHRFLGDG